MRHFHKTIMPAGRYRSRTFRRVFRRVPSGVSRLSYRKRKPSKATCAACGGVLKGVLRQRPTKRNNTTKTKKRPQRPFGGMLCSRCMRRKIIKSLR